jgi:DNA polymerase (family 10)
MENVEIAHVLNQYADLLEIQGADLFRIQAYRNAARTIESLSQSVTQLLETGKDLKKLKLPGIGKSMSEHIEEIVKSGTLTALKELRKKLPGKVDELLENRGTGTEADKITL